LQGLHARSFGKPITTVGRRGCMQIYKMNPITSQSQFIQIHFRGSSSARASCNVVPFVPISLFVKLNIDGNSLGNLRPSNFEGIVQDSQEFWLSEFYDHITNMHVKLFVILNGIRYL